MKLRPVTIATIVVVSFFASFWLYGAARTLRETVLFSGTTTLFGLLLGVGVPLAVVGSTLTVQIPWFRGRRSALLLIIFSSLSVGSAVSEAWILWDETQFLGEIENTDASYSRARAWPNQGCSLVFVPGRGVHATD